MESGTDREEAGGGGDPQHASFRVEGGPTVVVHVAGELDADSSPHLRRRLDEAFESRPRAVAVELADLDFVDSVGLSVLVAAHNRGRTEGTPFEVRNVSAGPRRILEITGLLDVLDLR